MKTNITVLLLFLVQLSVFGQAKVIREVEKFWSDNSQEWINSSEIIYQYDANKEVTLFQESNWSNAENIFIGEKQITYEYFDLSTYISEFRAIYDGKLYWILSDNSERLFNENGCETQLKEKSVSVEWRWEYEYFGDCLIKSATRYSRSLASQNDDWYPSERITYTYGNNNKNISFTAEEYVGLDEWSLLYKGHEYYDDRGNLIEKYNNGDETELFENTYDDKDRLVHQILYRPAGPDDVLSQRREIFYEYFEDENGYLTKKLFHRRYFDEVEFLTGTLLYENYCDGLVKTEEYIPYSGTRKKWFYEYDESTNCLETEEIKMQISPNPTSSTLTISSELLLLNTDISIFSGSGQLIQNLPVTHRTEVQEINLEALPNGVYYVRLKSDDHSITEPFVILK